MAEVDIDVAVAGAGPAGATAAILLASLGLRVAVFERVTAQDRAGGAALLLQPNGLAVLHGMGLRDALEAAGPAVHEVVLRSQSGRVVADMSTPDFGGGFDHVRVVRRRDLDRLLHERLAAIEQIQLHRGATVESADRTGRLVFHDRVGRHTVRARLVIGADGIRSPVRTSGDFGAGLVRPGYLYARMVVHNGLDQPCQETWTGLGTFGTGPLGGGDTYAFASVRHPDLQRALRRRDLGGFVDRWVAELPSTESVLRSLRSIDDLLVSRAGTVRCRTFVDGAAVVVGDAAHAMAPHLGQGANSALLDAAVLALELARGPDQASALARFDAQRRRRVAAVQRNSERLARIAHLASAPAQHIRDRLLATAVVIPRVVTRRARATQQTDPRVIAADIAELLDAGRLRRSGGPPSNSAGTPRSHSPQNNRRTSST